MVGRKGEGQWVGWVGSAKVGVIISREGSSQLQIRIQPRKVPMSSSMTLMVIHHLHLPSAFSIKEYLFVQFGMI